jgi:glycosyltransferase involved in cell wall biosynthesis
MVAAAIAGCHVRIIHSRNSSCEHIKADKLLRPLMYATYTDGFACGQKAGEWLFKNRPFTIMKNGKDIDRFLFDKEKREEYREKLHTTENEILLGHVGLFHRQKNHDFLIDVFAEICKRKNNYKLVLMGEGDEKQRIQEKVKALGLAQRVIFLGQQTNVEDWLQAMDIMVFPSLFEGMPNVVLEWQICGLPALISSEITQECKITDGVKYLPLDKGAAYWADQILQTEIVDRDGKQEAIKKVFAEAGFDIRKNAEILRTKYEELYSRRS